MTQSNAAPSKRSFQIGLLVALSVLTVLAAFAARATRPVETGMAPSPPAQATPVLPGERPRIEVAFVVDTTGSMSGLLEGAKQKIWSIANQLASGQPAPDIRVGLVAYRDRNDDYVTRTFDLTEDIDDIYGQLRQLSAGGGGDTPESVNQALHEAVTKLSWSEGRDLYKVIFLVGDAPPHLDYANDIPYTTSLADARDAHITVNTIQCGAMVATTPIWREIAQAGHGQYAAIAQDGAMVALETPMDAELADLNRKLAGTVLAYGDAERKAELRAKRGRSIDAPATVAAARLSYLAKKGGKVISGRSDLVDAIASGEADLDELGEEALPAEMQALEPAARPAYLEEKARERAQIQKTVTELSNKRDAYVEAELDRREKNGSGDGFDDEVRRTIRDQAAKAGIRWE